MSEPFRVAITTDADVDPQLLAALLRDAGDDSFNMIDVDMDTSTSDMMLLFANGAAGGPRLTSDGEATRALSRAIRCVATRPWYRSRTNWPRPITA